jgi:hypothetical protein
LKIVRNDIFWGGAQRVNKTYEKGKIVVFGEPEMIRVSRSKK